MNVSSQLNNSFSNPNHMYVMDYLIKKLESRAKNLQLTRTALSSIIDFQDLIENKKDMIRHFFEIEDDLKQGTHALKALLSQNRDYAEQIDNLQIKLMNFEAKSDADLKKYLDLNERNEYLYQQSQNLNERNLFLEKELKIKDSHLSHLSKNNNNLLDQIKKLIEENNLIKIQLDSRSIVSEAETNKKCDEYEIVKTILSEREYKKKLINEHVKNHFTNNKKEDSNDKISIYKAETDKDVNNSLSKNISSDTKEKINRAELVSKLLLKAVESSENIDLLNKRFGKDFMQTMMSEDVTEEFLVQLDETLKCKNPIENKNNIVTTDVDSVLVKQPKMINSYYKFDDETPCQPDENIQKLGESFDQNKIYTITKEKECDKYKIDNEINSNNFSICKSSRSFTSEKNINRKKNISLNTSGTSINLLPIKFEDSLRNYKGSSVGKNKTFVNYTTSYGRNFDKNILKENQINSHIPHFIRNKIKLSKKN